LLPCTQDQVGRRQLDWHCTRHTPTSGWRRAPLRLLDLVGQAGIAVEVGVVGQLLGDLLHLVDGDWHPGGGRLLSLSSLVVVPAVGQLGVGSTNVRHGVAAKNWVPIPTAQLQVPRPEKTAGGADHHLGADPHPQGAGGHRGVAQQLQLQPQCQHALPGPTAPEELSSVHEQWWCVAFSANPAGVAQSDSKCRQATAPCKG